MRALGKGVKAVGEMNVFLFSRVELRILGLIYRCQTELGNGR